jgi:hypothetical protein
MEVGTNAARAIPSIRREITTPIISREKKRTAYANDAKIVELIIRRDFEVLSHKNPNIGLNSNAVTEMLETARPIMVGEEFIVRTYLGIRGTTT